MISPEKIEAKFTYNHNDPVAQILKKEIECYQALLSVIYYTVDQLYNFVTGDKSLPIEFEKLWKLIQANRIPHNWILLSYGTAHETLAEYIIELAEKLKYWHKLFNEFDSEARMQDEPAIVTQTVNTQTVNSSLRNSQVSKISENMSSKTLTRLSSAVKVNANSSEVDVFHISYFFDPYQLLCAQIQRRARLEHVSSRFLYNHFAILHVYSPSDLNADK